MQRFIASAVPSAVAVDDDGDVSTSEEGALERGGGHGGLDATDVPLLARELEAGLLATIRAEAIPVGACHRLPCPADRLIEQANREPIAPLGPPAGPSASLENSLRLKRRLPTPNHASEAERASWALGQLGQWLHVEREVVGRHCTGRSARLDAVLRPHDVTHWRDSDVAFGVEFKLPCRESWDTREYTAWAAQMIDYTHVEWTGYGRLPILACPSLVEPFFHLPGESGTDRGSSPTCSASSASAR